MRWSKPYSSSLQSSTITSAKDSRSKSKLKSLKGESRNESLSNQDKRETSDSSPKGQKQLVIFNTELWAEEVVPAQEDWTLRSGSPIEWWLSFNAYCLVAQSLYVIIYKTINLSINWAYACEGQATSRSGPLPRSDSWSVGNSIRQSLARGNGLEGLLAVLVV